MPERLRSAVLFVAGACVLGAAAGLLAPGRPTLLVLIMPVWGSVVAWDRYHRESKRRVSRAELSQCIHCGYDLTGNVSGVCPECGKVK